MLREEMLAAGVPEAAIAIVPREDRAVDTALRAARPGDLLLVFGDAVARTWKQIVQFDPSADGAAPPPGRTVPRRDDADELPLVAVPAATTADLAGAGWIRDERGVHLALEEDD
jgi:cyanophycin synthetase